MKLKIQFEKEQKHILETKRLASGGFEVYHNGELTSVRGAGCSEIDAIRQFSDSLIYGDLVR